MKSNAHAVSRSQPSQADTAPESNNVYISVLWRTSDSLHEIVHSVKVLKFQQMGSRKQGTLGKKGFLLNVP